MDKFEEIEHLIKQFIDKTNAIDISLTGAINTSDGTLLGFKNNIEPQTENMFHITTMIENKGEISEFRS